MIGLVTPAAAAMSSRRARSYPRAPNSSMAARRISSRRSGAGRRGVAWTTTVLCYPSVTTDRRQAMSEQTVDPVHGVRYEFERQGNEVLTVETWMRDGGGLPKHYHSVQEEIWWVVDG